MTAIIVIVVVAVVAVAIIAAVTARGRRSTDDIASFRRQIDALSPEARRPTIDQMKPSDDAPADDDDADGT